MLKLVDKDSFPKPQRVAVVGSGISGLGAAWLLSQTCDVTLFEADERVGGHSNTVPVETDAGTLQVDTGFIVHNDRNYPNLVAFFEELGVPTQASDMSFAASVNGGAFEYSGTNLASLLGQKSNIVRLRFWQMLADILRFYRQAPQALGEAGGLDLTLGEYLERQGYSHSFVHNHILPMGAAIWSTTAKEMRSYPLLAFVRFFESHGLLSLKQRPKWRTVTGGSQAYVKRILADFSGLVRLNARVNRITRLPAGVMLKVEGQGSEIFDAVVIASHGDQALGMLAAPTPLEENLLSSFKYTPNEAVLHSDPSLMPKRQHLWASWNYIGETRESEDQRLCVSYWMNRLQKLPGETPLFVTLNPCRDIDPAKIYERFHYTHPLFDSAAINAQKDLWRLQGEGGIWYCGAHFGSGFHEDGLQSGLAVAEAIGGLKRPWDVAEESGRIHLPPQLAAAQ